MTTDTTTATLPTPIRKNLQRMLELKVGIAAMEAEFNRLRDGILATKYAPQVYGDPLLGVLKQRSNVTYAINVPSVRKVIGDERLFEIAKVGKTDLEKAVTKVEMAKLENMGAIMKSINSVTYSFTAAKPPKDAK